MLAFSATPSGTVVQAWPTVGLRLRISVSFEWARLLEYCLS
jgi:hypothetical protein